MRRTALVLLACLGAMLALHSDAVAHEIPARVTVRAFVKPTQEHLNLLVRVPLEAMQDLEWPTDRQGYLDLKRIDSVLRDAATLWISDNIELYENGALLSRPEILAQRVSLPTDRSFGSYPDAMAWMRGPALPEETQLYWKQGMLDMLFAYPTGSDRSEYSIRTYFAHLGLRVTTALFFLPPGKGAERAFQFSGDSGVVLLDPRWHQASLHFVQSGIQHILDGIDHLLFLLCLVIPLRRFRSLVMVVTSFTIAHSITLMASALGVSPTGLWFPPLIETAIAVSIVYMAIENIIGGSLEHRWIVAFGFGLVHGFGFSFALQETLQFAGRHLLTSLLSFNLGVEIGQLLVIAILIPALHTLFQLVVAPRMGSIILSVLVGHTALHWMIERGQALSQYTWPTLTAAMLPGALRWLAAGVALVGFLWLITTLLLGHQLQEVAKGAETRPDEPASPFRKTRSGGGIRERWGL